MTYTLPPGLTAAETAVFASAASTPIPPEWENPHLALGSNIPDTVMGSDPDGESRFPIHIAPEVAAAMPPVVGLQGKPHAGKDTVAWIAALGLAAAGRRALVIGTSDPVIEEANRFLFDAAPGQGRVVGHGNKSWGPYRTLLQTLGEVRRRPDPYYWNKPHRANIERIQREEMEKGNGLPVIFITGLRTPPDLELIQGAPLACPAVRVYRADNQYAARSDHWIERQLDHVPDSDFQFVIHNSDIAGLRIDVQDMCETLAYRESYRLH